MPVDDSLVPCSRCKVVLKRNATITSYHDDKTRCGQCHREVAGGMIPDFAEGCTACEGTSRNSKGGPCTPCQRRRALVEVAVAYVCQGCKEGLLLEGPGMEVIEPPEDASNKWHQACWTQEQQRRQDASPRPRRRRRAASTEGS